MWSLRFEQTIGAGAFGTVYQAELSNDQGLTRNVAVKMISQGHADSEMFLSRMRDEARLLGMLKDRHVIHVLDLINLEGRDAIVMEYVYGADMGAVLDKNHPIPAAAIGALGATIAGALDRAHRAVHPEDGTPLGVVHRDVKPENIMLTPEGDLRLLDFGVARARFAARESSTGQLVLGTLNYMAPDYIITGKVRPALDVYGLGLTLWELATGEVYGQPKVREDTHQQRLDERMAVLPDTHAPLQPVLRQMLSWRPEDRPTAGDLEVTLANLWKDTARECLATFAAEAVPPLIHNRPETPDTEALVGRTFRIHGPRHPPPVDDYLDTSIVPTDHSPTPAKSQPAGLRPQEDTLEGLTRQNMASNSVTLDEAQPFSVVPAPLRPASSAILVPVLLGSLVGILAVAGFAFYIFH